MRLAHVHPAECQFYDHFILSKMTVVYVYNKQNMKNRVSITPITLTATQEKLSTFSAQSFLEF